MEIPPQEHPECARKSFILEVRAKMSRWTIHFTLDFRYTLNLWTRFRYLFCPGGSKQIKGWGEIQLWRFFYFVLLDYKPRWARELVKVTCSCLGVDSKESFIKIEKQDLLLSGYVFLCSSLVCTKEPPREAGSCLSIWYRGCKSLSTSSLSMISTMDDFTSSLHLQDIWQGPESFLVVPLDEGGGLVESSV